MRYNKFILYYPDLSLGGSEKSKDDTEMEQYSPDKTPQSKKITALKVQNDSRFIDAGGENRVISIIGTVDAGFTLTIKDSSGCSIMEEELEDVKIPKGGVYKFHQNFPSIIIDAGGGLIEEYYEVIITPHADVEVNEPIKRGVPTFTLYQYPDPTITLATTTSQTSPALAIATSGVTTRTGKAGAYGDSVNEIIKTISYTITEDSAANGNFYAKPNISWNDNVTKSTMLKRVAIREDGESPTSRTLNLKPLTTRTRSAAGNTTNISSELSSGMTIKCNVEKTKTVINSLEVPSCKRKTDKFELSDTKDLFKDMFMYEDGRFVAKVISIDCDKNITVSRKVIIEQGTGVVFKHTTGATVARVESQINSKGNACIVVDREVYIPNGAVLEFDDDTSIVSGAITVVGSGSDNVNVRVRTRVVKYGTVDVTYTLDLDKIITRKPNARNIDVETSKNVVKTIYLYHGDYDSNALLKTITATNKAKNASVAYNDASAEGFSGPTVTYTPNKSFTGSDIVKYKLVDDDESADVSDEKVIRVTVK